jgi:hypothetical protein
VKCILDERPSIFITERMLHKGYDRKGSVAKKSLVVSLKGLGVKMN